MMADNNQIKEKKKKRASKIKLLVERHRRTSALTEAKKTMTKIILVGSTKSGKTSLAKRFAHQEFDEKVYQPTVEDAYFRNYKYGKIHFQIEIIDMPSPFLFPVMRDLHIKAANVAMLIYEIDNQASYTEAMNAWKRIRELRDDAFPVVLVGTKQDLMAVSRNLEECTANMMSIENDVIDNDLDVQHILTSAKDDVGVKEAFEMCLDEVRPSDEGSSSSTLSLSDFPGNLCCCCGI